MSMQSTLDVYTKKRYPDIFCSKKLDLTDITVIAFDTQKICDEDNKFIFDFCVDSATTFIIYGITYFKRCSLRLESLNQINNIFNVLFGAIFHESITYIDYRRGSRFRKGILISYRKKERFMVFESPFEEFKYLIPIEPLEWRPSILFTEDKMAF